MFIIIIIIIGVFWMQHAVILFIHIVDLGSELFSEVEFYRLIFAELIKFGFKSSDRRCHYYIYVFPHQRALLSLCALQTRNHGVNGTTSGVSI